MKLLQDYGLELVWASCFVEVKGLEQLFNANHRNLYVRHWTVWAGLEF